MPYVRMMTRDQAISRELANDLADLLQPVVARELSVPASAALKANEITIDWVPMCIWTDSPDRMECDVQLLIMSNIYPERDEIRDAIAEKINQQVAKLLPPKRTCWTWLCLERAGFAKSNGTGPA